MSNSSMDRRAVIRGAAVVAAGATLSACSSSSAAAPSAASTTRNTSEANAIGNVSETPTTVSGGPTASLTADQLGNTADVKVGSGVIYDKKKVVVTQPTTGTFKAFTAVCTHQGCIVSTVEDGKINCPCHGSAFSIKDGSVVNGPATTGLKAVKVTVAGDTLTLG